MAERARIARRCRRTRCEVPQSRAAIPLKHFFAIVVGDFPGAGYRGCDVAHRFCGD
jgi:hypothetical protein